MSASFLDFEGTNPASAAKEAAESLHLARKAAEDTGIRSFLFHADSVDEFDARTEIQEVREALVRVEKTASTNSAVALVDSLRREFVAVELNCLCKTGQRCSCDKSGDCKCVEPKQAAQVTGPAGSVGVLYGDDGTTYQSFDGGTTWDRVGSTSRQANQWIKHRGNKWVIIQKGSGKVLSTHDSEADAQNAFEAMMAHKHGQVDSCPSCGQSVGSQPVGCGNCGRRTASSTTDDDQPHDDKFHATPTPGDAQAQPDSGETLPHDPSNPWLRHDSCPGCGHTIAWCADPWHQQSDTHQALQAVPPEPEPGMKYDPLEKRWGEPDASAFSSGGAPDAPIEAPPKGMEDLPGKTKDIPGVRYHLTVTDPNSPTTDSDMGVSRHEFDDRAEALKAHKRAEEAGFKAELRPVKRTPGTGKQYDTFGLNKPGDVTMDPEKQVRPNKPRTAAACADDWCPLYEEMEMEKEAQVNPAQPGGWGVTPVETYNPGELEEIERKKREDTATWEDEQNRSPMDNENPAQPSGWGVPPATRKPMHAKVYISKTAGTITGAKVALGDEEDLKVGQVVAATDDWFGVEWRDSDEPTWEPKAEYELVIRDEEPALAE